MNLRTLARDKKTRSGRDYHQGCCFIFLWSYDSDEQTNCPLAFPDTKWNANQTAEILMATGSKIIKLGSKPDNQCELLSHVANG